MQRIYPDHSGTTRRTTAVEVRCRLNGRHRMTRMGTCGIFDVVDEDKDPDCCIAVQTSQGECPRECQRPPDPLLSGSAVRETYKTLTWARPASVASTPGLYAHAKESQPPPTHTHPSTPFLRHSSLSPSGRTPPPPLLPCHGAEPLKPLHRDGRRRGICSRRYAGRGTATIWRLPPLHPVQ